MRIAGLSILALVMGLVAGVPAFAEIGAIDAVPAATLLLPHFQIDLNNPNGVTTLFSINNASAAPAIARVTLWTDLSVPTLGFNVFLTGYDGYTMNLRDLFTTGVLPATSHSNTAISPLGPFSITTAPPPSSAGPGAASCNGQLPLPPLPVQFLVHLRTAHTGQASPVLGGACSGAKHGDTVARGYITVDNVNVCTLLSPSEAGYFIAGGTGTASNVNQLWGDYFFVNPGENFAQGDLLVHLEASNTLGSGNYTFYRRYSGGADQREGLGSTWATRYLNGGVFNGGTNLLVWRDAKRTINPFSCSLGEPAPFPLTQNQIVAFDEEENPDVPIPGAGLTPFPWESNLARVGGPDFPVPFNFGWLYLNLSSSVSGSQVPFEPLMQNHVAVIHSAEGRFSVGYGAVAFDNVTSLAAASVFLPICDGAPDPAACP